MRFANPFKNKSSKFLFYTVLLGQVISPLNIESNQPNAKYMQENPIISEEMRKYDLLPESPFTYQDLKGKLTLEREPFWEEIYDKEINKILKSGQLENLEKAFKKATRFRDHIQESGFDLNYMLARIIVESRGELKAKSPTGPKGLTQLARGTARSQGLIINRYVDERYDPKKAIIASDNYSWRLFDLYHNGRDKDEMTEEQLSFAYHEGHITRKQGKDLYDKINSMTNKRKRAQLLYYLPRVGAVKRMLDRGLICYEQPDLFSDKLERTYTVKAKPKETIDSLSEEHDISISKIKEYNPTIKTKELKPYQEVKIPYNGIQE